MKKPLLSCRNWAFRSHVSIKIVGTTRSNELVKEQGRCESQVEATSNDGSPKSLLVAHPTQSVPQPIHRIHTSSVLSPSSLPTLSHLPPSTYSDEEYGLSVWSSAPLEEDSRLLSIPFKLAITSSLGEQAIFALLGEDKDEEWRSRVRALGDKEKVIVYVILDWMSRDPAGRLEDALVKL